MCSCLVQESQRMEEPRDVIAQVLRHASVNHGKVLNCHARSSKRYTLTEMAISLYILCAGGCIGPIYRPRSARRMSSWSSYQVTTVTSDGSSNSSAPASTGYFGGAGGPSLPHLVAFTLATIGVAFTLGEQRQGH